MAKSIREADTSPALAEGIRLMRLCNACRYCSGLCAVFQAMERQRDFDDGDVQWLANLCHNCGACQDACQFAAPHEFNVNVPKTFAVIRNDSYAYFAWPRFLAPLFARNGLWVTLIAALSVAAFLGGLALLNHPAELLVAQQGPGAFYRLLSHQAMVVLFASVFAFAIVAISLSVRRLWRETKSPPLAGALWPALRMALSDAATLRQLKGGGGGCNHDGQGGNDPRSLAHHATFYGFLLCFAATSVATLYHYIGGRDAPYPWWDAPVVLGTLGGIGMTIGPAALLLARHKRDPARFDQSRTGMDVAFLVMLLATSTTGLLLLFFRETAAMGVLLALHLGVVFGLFLTMPYSRFIHGFHRLASLLRFYATKAGRHSTAPQSKKVFRARNHTQKG